MKNKKCKKSAFYRFWHWYIKGEYHCDKCPYGWEEKTSYEYDEWDAGCYIKGDIRDTCRLLPPFRWVVGYLRKRKYEYLRSHEYDDYEEWQDRQNAREEKMCELLNKFLKNLELCAKDGEGNYYQINKEIHIDQENYRIRYEYEDFIAEQEAKASPYQNPWKKAILWTWHKFIDFFKPYFCK